jgi:small subunit ribosomal protein S17
MSETTTPTPLPEPLDGSSTSAAPAAERGQADAPAAERWQAHAPAAERWQAHAPAAERGQAHAPAAERGRRKVREGYVVSDKMDKTVVVAVEDRVKHRLYGKVLRQTARLKAHDEANSAGIGDRVRIMETRPLSATKRWRLVEILEKAK